MQQRTQRLVIGGRVAAPNGIQQSGTGPGLVVNEVPNMPSMAGLYKKGRSAFALRPQVVLVRLKPDPTRARSEIELHVEAGVACRQNRGRRQPGAGRAVAVVVRVTTSVFIRL